MDDTAHPTRCFHCGANLLTKAQEGLCPVCLLPVAAGTTAISERETLSALTVMDLRGTPLESTRLPPGQVFGAYRIVRLLGCGGMGDVYEAEHIEQGRRVALKLLNRRLTGGTDRARFLREGQLAASISHPHTVCIFGSEEIDGTPAIVMELLPGGTLKDRVKARGHLPAREAVDAILQVVAGLEAM